MSKQSEAKEKPAFCTDEHLTFLDELRESGETNMLGGAMYLDEQFPELSDGDARSFGSSEKAGAILLYWMASFESRHPRKTS